MTRAEFEEIARKYSPELLGLPRKPDSHPPQSTLPDGRSWSDLPDPAGDLVQLSVLLDPSRLCLWDEAGLTVTQLRALGHVSEQDGLGNTELANRLGLGRPTVSSLLGRLERDGFIRREISVDDRRYIRIFMQPAGWEAITSCGEEVRQHVAGFLADLTEERLRRVTEAFLALAGAVPVAARAPARRRPPHSA